MTGPAAIQADLAAVFDGANFRLLGATAGVVALLLIITYRSPVLWLVPLTVVGVADQLAAVLATRTLAAFDVQWDESTIGILSVLVFGAGTDYALLLISRYRDELRVTEDRREAMAHALRRTAEAVLSSAVHGRASACSRCSSRLPDDPRARARLRRRRRRGSGLRAPRPARRPRHLRPLDLLAPGAPRGRRPASPTRRSLWRRVGDARGRRPALAGSSPSRSSCWRQAAGITAIDTGLDVGRPVPPEARGHRRGRAARRSPSRPARADPVVVVSRGGRLGGGQRPSSAGATAVVVDPSRSPAPAV